jgi:hypothetical protein
MTTTESAQARNEAQLRQLIAGQTKEPLPHCAASQRERGFIKLQSEQTHLRPRDDGCLERARSVEVRRVSLSAARTQWVPARPTVG